MPKPFADWQAGVNERVQDDAGKLTAAERDNCIKEAIAGRYSRARPLRKVQDLIGDGATFKWTLNSTNFPGWGQDFSIVLALYYPAGESTERVPPKLEQDEWITYWPSSTAPELRLLRITPASGKKLRVEYSAPHSEDASTVPDNDFFGGVNLAASLAAWRLRAAYTQLGDSAIGADAVDYRGKADGYAALARALEERFKELFSLDKEEEQPAASVSQEWPEPLSEGSDRLTH